MTTATNERAEIIAALYRWIAQRPGLEFGNYGDQRSYRSEMRGIIKTGTEARKLLRYVEQHESITADMLKAAFPRAFCGRLSWELLGKNTTPHMGLSYCTGQYWPTEYRKAACDVLASAIWEFWRTACMPEPKVIQHGNADNLPMRTELRYKGLSGGDYIRRMARNEFGRGIASRWFN